MPRPRLASLTDLLRWCAGIGVAMAGAHVSAGDHIWRSQGPYGGTVRTVAVDPFQPGVLYAMSSGGLFRSEDAGDRWRRIERGLPNPANRTALALDGDVAGRIHVFDSAGVLYRSLDQGSGWRPTGYRAPSDVIPMRIVDPPGSSTVLLIALSADRRDVFPNSGVMILRSTDAGSGFAPVTGIPAQTGFRELVIDPTNPTIVLAGRDGLQPATPPAISPPLIFRSSNGGQSFIPVYAPSVNPGLVPAVLGIAFGASDRVYASIDGVGVLRSDDNGLTWTELGGTAERLVAHPTLPDRVFSTHREGFSRSYDGGVTWVPMNGGLFVNGNFLDPISGTPITARGLDLVATPDFPDPDSQLWLGTAGGGLFRSGNYGQNWVAAGNEGLSAVAAQAVAVHPNPGARQPGGSGDQLYAGHAELESTTAGVYASNSGGSSWAASNSGLNLPTVQVLRVDQASAIGEVGNTSVYAGGRASAGSSLARHGGILRSRDGGVSWTRVDGDLPTSMMGDGYIELGTVRDLRLDPRSCTLPITPSSPPCSSGPLKRLFATTVGHRYPFESARRLSHRVLRTDNADETDLHPVRGTPDVQWTDISGDLPLSTESNSLRQRVNPADLLISPTDPSVLFIATIKDFQDFDPSDPIDFDDRPTGVFKTSNGGANWVQVSAGLPRVMHFANVVHDVLALEMHPTNPDVLWAALREPGVPNSGAIYRSIDGGNNWTWSSSGIPTQSDIRDLQVDASDANIVYAASAGTPAHPGGVYRSSDGGATWFSISVQLPADSALSLALDPSDPSVLHAATNTGIWTIRQAIDVDRDGVPDATESGAPNGGDGNYDGTLDAVQRDVGSSVIIIRTDPNLGNPGAFTSDLRSELSTPTQPDGCQQAVDVYRPNATELGEDPANGDGLVYAYPLELAHLEIQHCSHAVVDLIYHGADFIGERGWSFRFRGPQVPGDDGSFGWFDFAARATLLPPTSNTWRLTLDANQFGSYRPGTNSILVVGGPACLDEHVHSDGFEDLPPPVQWCRP